MNDSTGIITSTVFHSNLLYSLTIRMIITNRAGRESARKSLSVPSLESLTGELLFRHWSDSDHFLSATVFPIEPLTSAATSGRASGCTHRYSALKAEAHTFAQPRNHTRKEFDWSISLRVCQWTNQFPYAHGYAAMQKCVLPPQKLISVHTSHIIFDQ
jgi:hypothetical protein